MSHLRTATVIAAAVALSGCGAGFARLGTYGMDLADANTSVDGRRYSLYVHPRDKTVMAQRGMGAVIGQSAIEGFTLGAVSMQEPMPIWRSAMNWLLEPAGCTILSIYELERTSFEAEYQCPEGVDLRRLVMENRATLRDGQPLPRQ